VLGALQEENQPACANTRIVEANTVRFRKAKANRTHLRPEKHQHPDKPDVGRIMVGHNAEKATR
jgi:hypothetical protein